MSAKSGNSSTRKVHSKGLKRFQKDKSQHLEPQPVSGRLAIERSNKRGGGSWETQKWLIGKKLAHVVKERLIADLRKAVDLEETNSSKAKGDRGRMRTRSRRGR